jgi:hypothetical protein
MMVASSLLEARRVLSSSLAQVVQNLADCGSSGGTGRAQLYAPILVNTKSALDIVQGMIDREVEREISESEMAPKEVPDSNDESEAMKKKMAALREKAAIARSQK